MDHANYQAFFRIKSTDRKLFEALTLKLSAWWSPSFVGSAQKVGDQFTIRFNTALLMVRVKELIPDKKVVWQVENVHGEMSNLKDDIEWTGTTIEWGIHSAVSGTSLTLTHIGLTTEKRGYAVSKLRWADYTENLINYLTKGSKFVLTS